MKSNMCMILSHVSHNCLKFWTWLDQNLPRKCNFHFHVFGIAAVIFKVCECLGNWYENVQLDRSYHEKLHRFQTVLASVQIFITTGYTPETHLLCPLNTEGKKKHIICDLLYASHTHTHTHTHTQINSIRPELHKKRQLSVWSFQQPCSPKMRS